jgi:hypothetical protein
MWRDDRGQVLAVAALAMTVFLGMLALSIDLGMVYTARTESQRAADAAALAGAGKLVQRPGDVAAARAEAKHFASLNRVRKKPVQLEDDDIEILLSENKVRVSVKNSRARGNSIRTIFARILGIDEVDVSTVAAAQALGAGEIECPLPIALPDKWIDNGNGKWDPGQDYYVSYEDDPVGNTGYGEADVGTRLEIKTAPQSGNSGPSYCGSGNAFDACNAFDHSWRCWWREALPSDGGDGGAATLSRMILPGCSDPAVQGLTKELGETIYAASGAGNEQSLVTGAFADLVDSDPAAVWDSGLGCVTRSGEEGCVDSDRIRSLPIVDPNSVSPLGGANTNAVISNFANVFVEKVSCSPNVDHKVGPAGRWNVYVRLMTGTGSEPTDRNDALVKALRLVE